VKFKLDDASLAELRRLWSGAIPPWELAPLFGLTPREARRERDGAIRAEAEGWARARRRREAEARREAERRARRAAEVAARHEEIRRLWAEGEPGPDLVEWFGLAKSTISGIVAGLPPRRRYGDPWEASWPHPRRRPAARPAPPRRVPTVAAAADALGAFRPGRFGSDNGRSKLDRAAVGRLRELRAEGWTYPALAREFGISRSNVFYILSGKTWGPAPAKGGGG